MSSVYDLLTTLSLSIRIFLLSFQKMQGLDRMSSSQKDEEEGGEEEEVVEEGRGGGGRGGGERGRGGGGGEREGRRGEGRYRRRDIEDVDESGDDRGEAAMSRAEESVANREQEEVAEQPSS